MNKIPFSNLILLLLPLIMLTSCKIEKRLYRPGYHVEWKGQKANLVASVKNDKSTHLKTQPSPNNIENEIQLDYSATASVHQHDLRGADDISKSFRTHEEQRSTRLEMPCDTVRLLSNEVLVVRLIEITLTEVKYKRCDLPKGPLYVIPVGDVNYIIYGNGDQDYFADPPIPDSHSEVQGDNRIAEQEEIQVAPDDAPKAKRKLEIFGLIAFIFALGAAIISVFLAPVAIILAVISLLRHNENENKFMGSGFAQAALFIGILAFVVYVIFGPMVVLW